MLIAHVTFTVAATYRQAALDCLLGEAEEVRSMPGCISFIPFADVSAAGGVGVLHEWRAARDFAGYTASESFARFSKAVRPMMVAPPVSRRFEAVLLESVN
jgi:quinol monooxygenase YgiN